MDKILTIYPPPDLLRCLANKWTIPPPTLENRTVTRSKRVIDAGSGGTRRDGREYLHLPLQPRPTPRPRYGLRVLSWNATMRNRTAAPLPLHAADRSLRQYPPRLCALVGADLTSAELHVVTLTPMAFAGNDSFLGSAERFRGVRYGPDLHPQAPPR